MRDELVALSGYAAAQAWFERTKAKPPIGGPPLSPPPDIALAVQGAVLGMFNVSALSMQGLASSTQERIAKATEASAASLANIEDQGDEPDTFAP